MYNMPAVHNKKFVALMLEEAFPDGCVIEGVDFSAGEAGTSDENNTLPPSFLQRYEDIANSELRQRQEELADMDSDVSSRHNQSEEKLLEEKKMQS